MDTVALPAVLETDDPMLLGVLALLKGWVTEYAYEVAHFKEIAHRDELIGFRVKVRGVSLIIGIRLDIDTCTDETVRGVLVQINDDRIKGPTVHVILERVNHEEADRISVRTADIL